LFLKALKTPQNPEKHSFPKNRRINASGLIRRRLRALIRQFFGNEFFFRDFAAFAVRLQTLGKQQIIGAP